MSSCSFPRKGAHTIAVVAKTFAVIHATRDQFEPLLASSELGTGASSISISFILNRQRAVPLSTKPEIVRCHEGDGIEGLSVFAKALMLDELSTTICNALSPGVSGLLETGERRVWRCA